MHGTMSQTLGSVRPATPLGPFEQSLSLPSLVYCRIEALKWFIPSLNTGRDRIT
jgi:hypothetical protein